MSENSKIEWTDATWNPVLGCDKISPGCKNCYAIKTAWRLQHNPNPKVAKAFEGLTVIQGGQPNWTGRVNFVPDRLDEPLGWRKPRNIFVNSQSDLFHEGIDFSQIAAIFGVMAASPWHTYQVLTKRPARMLEFFRWIVKGDVSHPEVRGCTLAMAQILRHRAAMIAGPGARGEIDWPLPNVWLGVSVEDQQYADERIPLLLQTPAAVRWISAEPLLGPVDLLLTSRRDLIADLPQSQYRGSVLDGRPRVDWVVSGGESGPNARPMHPDWARSLRDQCKAAGVPFFFKQWGEWIGASQISDSQPRGVKFLQPNGVIASDYKAAEQVVDAEGMLCVGKKAAGRKLDGVEHNEYPAVQG